MKGLKFNAFFFFFQNAFLLFSSIPLGVFGPVATFSIVSNDDATAVSCSLCFVDAVDTGEIGDGETGAGFVAVRKFVSFFRDTSSSDT